MRRRGFFGAVAAAFVKPAPKVPELYRIPVSYRYQHTPADPDYALIGSGWGTIQKYEIQTHAQLITKFGKIPTDAIPVVQSARTEDLC